MAAVQLHECCVVPYRHTSSGTEFCLVTPLAENRWEFPKIRLEHGEQCDARLLEQAAEEAGLRGVVTSDKPVGSYIASRHKETRQMVGFLMHVEQVEDWWPRQDSQRRIWCLAEEARVRIRRKPLRRFIDLALRSVKETADGTGDYRSNGAH